MNESDTVMFGRQREQYGALSNKVDIINALYNYSQLHKPVGIMKDLCDALEVDGYYKIIDDAFMLTQLKAPVSQHELRVRLKLKNISTLADDQWLTAYCWSVIEHSKSKAGIEFFSLQRFRANIRRVAITDDDAAILISELRNVHTTKNQNDYSAFLHYCLGFMPSYFSEEVKAFYEAEIEKRRRETNAALK